MANRFFAPICLLILFLLPAISFAGSFDNYRDSKIYCGKVSRGEVAYNEPNKNWPMGNFSKEEKFFVCKEHNGFLLIADLHGSACDVLEVNALAWVKKDKVQPTPLFQCI